MTLTEAPVHHEYSPRGAALELFKRKEPEVVISGPSGTGKSRAALEKLNAIAWQNPGMVGLIVRKTAASLPSSGLKTWKSYVIGEFLESGAIEYFGGSRDKPPGYYYSNGSVIEIGGMDKSSKIMSTERDLIFVQEATELTIGDWEALLTRLRNGVVSFQQIIGDCNPAEDTHWLKKRCDAGTALMLHSRHEDNPELWDADEKDWTPRGKVYISRLDSLTGVRKRRLRHGEWSSAEGVVYEEWDSAIHLIDHFGIPDDWPRYWVVDFGFTNPFVCQFWAEDPDGRLYLYREWYRTQMLVADHARRILNLVTRPDRYGNPEWVEPQPRAIICDHDAEGRAQLDLALGIGTTPARKAVRDGIQAVKQRLQVAGDDKPRLFVLRDSLIERDPLLDEAAKPQGLVEEIGGYVWAESRTGVKEEPVKADDHSMDAMRYLVAHLDPLHNWAPRMAMVSY